MGRKSIKFFVDIISLQNEVTGSMNLLVCHWPDGRVERYLVDFGLYQGSEEQRKRNNLIGVDPSIINGILLTHAHVDHVGRIPLLFKNGANCKVFMTHDTQVIAEKLLDNTCKIFASDEKIYNQKALYCASDLERALKEFRYCEYQDELQLSNRCTAEFFENRHIAGASSILLTFKYPGYSDITIFCMGDYNESNAFDNGSMFTIPDRVASNPISLFLSEATYGSRAKSVEDIGKFKRIVNDELEKGKNTILIPAFSFGRFQNVLLQLKEMQQAGELSPDIPIYMDGGLGIDITKVWSKLETVKINKEFMPENCIAVGESRHEIIALKTPKIIVTTSGMCNFGPAREYVPFYFDDEDAVILFTGFMSEESGARRMLDAEVGDEIIVMGILKKKRCTMYQTTEFSSHAHKHELIKFIKLIKKIKFVLFEHGEAESKGAIAIETAKLDNVGGVGIIDGRTRFRINSNGLVKSFEITESYYEST